MRKAKVKIAAGVLATALCMALLPVAAYAYSDEPEETTGAEITAADVVAAAVEGYNAYTEAASEGAADGGSTTTPTESGIGAASGTSNPLTPDGTGTVVDTATDEDGKLFYTVMTEAGNVFYLVIDEQRATENVYFLNAVTEADLLALAAAEETSGTSGIGPVEDGTVEDPGETEPDPLPADEPGEETAEPEAGGVGGGTLVLVLLVVAGAGGAGYYFKVFKPKQQMLDEAEDFEDFKLEDDYRAEDEDDDLDLDTLYPLADDDMLPDDGGYFGDDDMDAGDLPQLEPDEATPDGEE